MRRLVVLVTCFLLISYSCLCSGLMTGRASDSLVVLSTPELEGMVRQWAKGYNNSGPAAMISVKTVSGNEMAEMVTGGQLGFIKGPGASMPGWKMVIARDVIVPVISRNNPFLAELAEKGISPGELSVLFGATVTPTWDNFLGNAGRQQVTIYFLDVPSVRDQLGELAGRSVTATGVATVAGLVSAIERDPGCIAFCRLSDIGSFDKGIMGGKFTFLPIDRNNNGLVDDNENIYEDVSSLERGIWIGKYPKAFYQNVVSVSGGANIPEKYAAFLGWIISDGQENLAASGLTGLLPGEQQKNADILAESKIASVVDANAGKSIFSSLLYILAALFIAFTAVNMIVKLFRARPSVMVEPGGVHSLNEESLILPKGILFDKTHSWAFMEQSGLVKIGIDDFLQHITGTISRIKMKSPGDKIRKGEEILTLIQNGKQLKVYSPVTGIIRERNETLEHHASEMNRSPYNEGWVYRMEPYNWTGEMQMLQMADRQKQFISEEISRVKEFLVSMVNSDGMKYSPVILQDGGMLVDKTLESLGPEIWEEFQMKFIDSSRLVWFYEIM